MKFIVVTIVACVLLAALAVWRVAREARPAAATAAAPGWATSETTPAQPTPVITSAAPPETDGPHLAASPARPAASATHRPASAAPTEWAASPERRAAERALRTANATLAGDPYHVAALRDRLAAERALEDWPAAAATLDRLMEIVPENADFAFARAGLHLRSRGWIEAAALLRTVVQRQPERVEAWFNLAVANQAARRLNDARIAWDRVVALNPADLLARTHRAEVLLDLHEWDAAAEDLRRIRAADSNDVNATLNLALALSSAGRGFDARALLEGALRGRPRDVRLLNRVAELCWSLHQGGDDATGDALAAAREYWSRSLAVDRLQPKIAERLAETTANPD